MSYVHRVKVKLVHKRAVGFNCSFENSSCVSAGFSQSDHRTARPLLPHVHGALTGDPAPFEQRPNIDSTLWGWTHSFRVFSTSSQLPHLYTFTTFNPGSSSVCIYSQAETQHVHLGGVTQKNIKNHSNNVITRMFY